MESENLYRLLQYSALFNGLFVAILFRRSALKRPGLFSLLSLAAFTAIFVLGEFAPRHNEAQYRLWMVVSRFCLGLSVVGALSLSQWMANRRQRVL